MKGTTSVRISLLAFFLSMSLVGSVSAEFPIGDLTGDCDVNSQDLQIFVGQWLDPSGCSGHPEDCADFDGLNGVNSTDFALFAANWLIKTGSLQVTILPPEAAAAEAQWRMDGGQWRDSGYTETCVSVGTHTIECKPIPDWNEPNSRTVQINEDQTTTTTETYIRHTGSLQVTILPPEAAAAGAKWRVDGGPWRDSGYTETGLAVGSHTVEHSVVSGWNKPADEIVQINNAQTTVTNGTYVLQTGSLQVTISPQAAIDAGAQWRVDGGPWRDSDYTESGLTVGSHTVEYGTVTGWNKPADETVQINDGLTTTTTGIYTQQTGYLQVTISPQGAIDAGAKWRVDGGVWRDSGYTLGSLIVGSHTVEFSTVTGWNTPADEMVQINDGQTTTITGTYIQQTGSLQVTILPPEAAAAGAHWRVDNRTWRESGYIETELSAGPHTIRYKDISDWNTPADETVQIYSDQTTTTIGTYTLQTGSLQVTIFPQEAIDAGAQWRVDGGTWRDSGYTETGLVVGSHTVEYSTISGWNEPINEMVQINNGQTTTTTGTYILQTGLLQVTISPQAAIDAGAQWRVDGGMWFDSGYTESGLLVGLHTVEYKLITDWNEPNSQAVQINDGQTTTTTGTYIQHTGSLQVTISPQGAIDAGAQWRVDGGMWRDSGYTETGLVVGSHTVEYSTISGWNEPINEMVQINNGQTTTTTGTYILQTGSLQVTISPQAAIDAGAQWRVDGGTWRDSGYTESGLLVGLHTVEYKLITDWNEPNSQAVQINDGQTTTTTGTYIQHTGSLQVTISPQGAIDAGAQWRVDGGTWRDSGYTETGLIVGSHTIEYSLISSWDTPINEIVQINDGQTTTTTGTYIQHTGSLQVTISPQGAIDAGAQWRVDGGMWRDSGYTETGLVVGSHTVEYSTISGWNEPINEMVQINNGQTTTTTGTYILQTGSLQVTISPQAAIDAGAQWRVDGGTWFDSGYTESGLLVGLHTVEYKLITDWNEPNSQAVQINDGQTTTTTGTYIQHTGSLQVTISPQGAIDAGAQWRVDGGTWRDSGYTETGLIVGSHTIEYSLISSWDTPINEIVQINNGQTTTVTGTFVLQKGSLQVTISPQAAIDAGAQWRVDGGTWFDSGYTESGLSVGFHTVEYKPIADWNEPNSQLVQINDGQTTTTTGTYTQHTGSLQVTILPLEAAFSGAQWRVDGGTWRSSGYIESGLSLGSHTIGYKAIVGWNTPGNENVEIYHGQTTTTTGTYIQQTGSLQVTIFPQEAVDAGAKWRVDDGVWRDSNYAETGLLVGFYSVEFSVVAGWDRPANQMVEVDYNQTTITSGVYVQQIHALLTINEFMASNASEAPLDPGELLDGNNESSDWIEIYNRTDESVSLDGWFLTDDDDELTRWQFPNGLQIDAGQFLIIFASGKTFDLYPLNYPYLDAGGYYHTNFNLDNSPGEYLALVAPDGNTIVHEYEPKYPVQLTNVSYGLARYEVTLVPTGATASYHVPTGADVALGTDWADVGFNDSSWDTGTTAIGFGGGAATDVQQQMQNVNTSLWTRMEFNLEDDQRDLFDTFLLRIKYEDGFVAYLNGQEVINRNAPNSVEWNSIANSNRPSADSSVFEEINLMPFLDTLRIGRNVLAIHGLNDDPADGEFLILPELVGASNLDVPQYFITATPGELNVADAMGLVGEVWFSHERGYYDTGFQLELSTAMDDAQIRYTTDGSRPSITHGTIYTGPISINQTTTVRAIAVKPGWLSANPDAHSYIFLYDVANQPASPPGFPTSWGSYTADYEVDPDVVNTTLPGYSFEEALLWIPSLCITMLTDDLFGADDGIYVYSTSTGDAWERPASIELIYPDGREGFQINAGVHLHGGASRNHSSTLKHSFRLVFRGIYGPTKLNFPLFEGADVEEFDQLVLRGSSGDSWTYPDSYRDGVIRHIKIQAQYTRDPWMKDTQRTMGHNSANSIFVHLYLNGLYWGQYNLCERPNSAFQASYLGGDKDEYDAIHDYEELQSGTFDIWNQLFDLAAAGLASDTDAQFIQGNNPDGTRNPNYPILLDVDNLIDYMILHHFARSEDWPCHNFWSGRRRGPQSEGFKFFVWDQENHNNTLERFITGCGCHIEVLPGEEARSLRPGYLYARLRENPMFRRKYGDRIHKHMFNDGLLTIEKVEERWMKRATEVDKSVVAESARWGDAKRSNPYKREVEFLTEQNRLHTEYWPFISAIVLDRYRGVGLYPDIEAPVFRINDVNQHGGNISKTDELTMDNPNGAGTIYYTTDGNDPRLPESTEIYGTTLVAEDAPKKVLVPTGSINDNWKGGGPFNDSSWNDGTFISGKAGGVGYDERADYKPFISYDVESLMNADLTSSANTSCYIRIPFTFNGDPCDFNFMSLNIRYDDGFVAYLNGDELDRKNFSLTATPAWNSNASAGHEATGLETIPISDHLGSLKQGDNILAIHGMNNSNTSSDFIISAQLVVSDVNSTSGGVSPDAIEYNNEHLTFNKSTHVKACVLEGETWSALNEAVFAVGPVAESLRITEIMYHPMYTSDPADPNTEFIELKNIGPETINLNLAEFTKGIDFIFPDIELESGEYVVVVKDIGAFQAKYGTSVTIVGQYSGSLANEGERIKLRDAVGRTILDFEYRDGWRSITDGEGFSLTIIDPTDSEPNNWDEKESWRASVYRNGSPGADDSGILPNPGAVVINEVMAHSNAGPDWIELHNTTDETINIGGWFLSDNDRCEPNLMKYRIADGTTIEPNDYLVFYQDTDFNNPGNPDCIVPFGLSENGEKACLSSYLDGNGFLTGYRQVEDFGASQTNVSLGRYFKPTMGNFNFVAMDYNTPDADNAYPKVGPVVINEIMYNPPSGNQNEEYIELHNITGKTVTLYRYDKSEPWKFTDGIDYTFSSGPAVTIPAYGYLMVAKNMAAFTARYGGMPSGVQVLTGYGGRLSNAGERLQIGMPGDIDELGTRQYIRIDRVVYSDGWHPEDCPGGVDLWPTEADGFGKSLSRKVSADYGNDVDNWEAATPSPGVANP